jgi:hypothetical protein
VGATGWRQFLHPAFTSTVVRQEEVEKAFNKAVFRHPVLLKDTPVHLPAAMLLQVRE